MIKIGIFFGTFNPIHNGHLMLASYLSDNTFLKEVWFCPTPDSTFKEHKDGLLPFLVRKSLIMDSIRCHNNLWCTDIEKDLPSPHYTVDTLSALKETYHHAEFYPILGADNIMQIQTFHDYIKLIHNYEIIVLPREGYGTVGFEQNFPEAKIHHFPGLPTCNLSSSFIRKQFAEGKNVSFYVPRGVADSLSLLSD